MSDNSAPDEHAPLSRQTGDTTESLEFISVSAPGHQSKTFERFKLAPPEPKKPAKNPAKKIAIIVALLLVGLVAWSVASDRLAPSSAKGAVAAYTTQIAPQVAGRVVSVSVQDNQVVHAGDPLFQLDPRPFELAVETAKANLAQVALTNEASAAALVASQARVAQAKAVFENTQQNVDRTRALAERGLAADSVVGNADASLVSAQTTLDAAQADYESARLKLGSGGTNPQLDLAQLQLEQAQMNLQFASVTAPGEGVITNLRLAPGQYTAVGAPALTFIATDALWIMTDMRENQLALVEPGMLAAIALDGQPGKVFQGRVQSIAWGIDTGRTTANGLLQNQASTRWFEPARTIPVHIQLTGDQKDWPANTRVGSKASVLIYVAGPDNPVSRIATGLQYIQSMMSFLY